MAVLPDLPLAGLYATVVFMIVLGLMVVFVEAIPRRALVGSLVATILVAFGFASLGEAGLGLLAVGFGSAVVAARGFEWLTTR